MFYCFSFSFPALTSLSSSFLLTFISTIGLRYVEKKWASRTATEPSLLVSQDKSVGTSRRGIPKKARKYSLDEEIFTEEMLKVAPITRNRGVFF